MDDISTVNRLGTIRRDEEMEAAVPWIVDECQVSTLSKFWAIRQQGQGGDVVGTRQARRGLLLTEIGVSGPTGPAFGADIRDHPNAYRVT